MKKRNVAVLAIITFAISLAALIVITRGQNQDKIRSSSEEKATPIQAGVMSETQRLHSKLYENKLHRNLRDMPRSTEAVISTPWGLDERENMPRTFDEFLRVSLCAADAVVVGSVKNNSSQLTTDGTFVFTDSDITVEEILKRTDPSIQIHRNILLTRPGGAVNLDGKLLIIRDKSFQPLQVEHRYLLFLRSIATTGAYQQVNSKSGFELSLNTVKKLSDEESSAPFFENDISPSSLIARVRAAASNCQGNGR